MNQAVGLLGLGLLNGLMNGWQQKQEAADIDKGLSSLAKYAALNDPNSKEAQAAYLAKTYSDPAYQAMDTRLNTVNKVAQDKSTWEAQNDIMTKAMQANDTAQYEAARLARDAAHKQAEIDRQGLAGLFPNLVGADVDLSNMPQDANSYMSGINLTPEQANQYLTDKANPAAALEKNYDPLKYLIGMQQSLIKSGVNMDTLQKLSPMLQQAQQNATENNTKQKYSQFIPSLLNGDQAQQKYALVNMYLTDPKRMPYEVMKELISSNVKPVDSGNQILMYRTDAYNNFLDSDQNGNPVPYITIDKQPSPDTALRVGEQRFEYTNPSANTLAQLKERQYEHDTPSGNAQLQSDTQKYLHVTPSGSIMYQANTPGKNAQVNQIKAMEQYLKLKYPLNTDEMVNDPVYKVYVSAIQGLSGAGGSNTDSQSTGSDSVADWINRVKQAGASKEQVLQSLHDKGYGNAYDSYVW